MLLGWEYGDSNFVLWFGVGKPGMLEQFVLPSALKVPDYLSDNTGEPCVKPRIIRHEQYAWFHLPRLLSEGLDDTGVVVIGRTR